MAIGDNEPYPEKFATNGIVKGQEKFELRTGGHAVTGLPYCCFCWVQFDNLEEANEHCDTSATHKTAKEDYYGSRQAKNSNKIATKQKQDITGENRDGRRSRRLKKQGDLKAKPKPAAVLKKNVDENLVGSKTINLTINPDLAKDLSMDVDPNMNFEELLSTLSDDDGDEDLFDPNTECVEDLDVNLKELAHNQGYICTLCHVNIPEGAHLRHHVRGSEHQRRLLRGSPAASSVIGKELFRGAEMKTKDEVEPIKELTHGQFYCKVCKVVLKSEEELDQHVQDEDHVRCEKDEKLLMQNLRMEKKYGLDYLKDMGIRVKEAGTWRRYHCEWCQDYFKLVSEARDHCGTHRHKENATRRRWEQEEFGSFLADYTEDLEWPTAPDISHLPTKHQLRQERIIRTNGQNVPGVTAGWYYCTTCKVAMETPEKISIHIKGRRHRLEKHFGGDSSMTSESWSGRKRRVSEASTVDTPRGVSMTPASENKDEDMKRQRSDYNAYPGYSRQGWQSDRKWSRPESNDRSWSNNNNNTYRKKSWWENGQGKWNNRKWDSRDSWKTYPSSTTADSETVVDDYNAAQDAADEETYDGHRRQWRDEAADAGRASDSDDELLGALA